MEGSKRWGGVGRGEEREKRSGDEWEGGSSAVVVTAVRCSFVSRFNRNYGCKKKLIKDCA